MLLTLALLRVVIYSLVPAACLPSGPQRPYDSGPVELTRELGSWRARHGTSWRMQRDPAVGLASLIYGGAAPAAYYPRSDSDWIAVARQHVVSTSGLHGIDGGTLEPDERAIRFLPLGRVPGGRDKVVVRFEQHAADIRVDDGIVNLLMAIDGTFLSLQSTASPFLETLELSAKLSASDAKDIAVKRFIQTVGLEPTRILGEPQILITQVNVKGTRVPRLAWVLDLAWSDVGVRPEAWRYWTDALDGSILRERSLVCSVDVGGTLSTWATDGILPDDETSTSDEVLFQMPYAEVRGYYLGNEYIAHTDQSGNWLISGVPQLTNVEFRYSGTHVLVNDVTGDFLRTESSLTGTANTIELNLIRDEYTTAEANAYLALNKVRDYVRDVQCDDCNNELADSLTTAFINENHCSPTGGGDPEIHIGRKYNSCQNQSYSTILAHEFGHVLNDRYETANALGSLNEGTADIWGMFVYDTEFIGKHLFNDSGYLRTGGVENTTLFCGSLSDSCYGEIHSDGLPWMGAAWKVREALNARHGNATGDMIADTLFLGWMNGYTHSNIESAFQLEWLELDDDDMNLDNGTPHGCDIIAGFRAHGFPDVCIPDTCIP